MEKGAGQTFGQLFFSQFSMASACPLVEGLRRPSLCSGRLNPPTKGWFPQPKYFSPFVPAPTVVSTIRRCQSNTVGERERPAGTLVGLSPNSEAGLGSARVPQAGSGVAPELWPPTISGIPGGKKFAGCGFRRAAENHAPGADAPQRPQPGREPGRLAAVGHGNGGGKTQGQLNLRGACGWRPSALRLKAPFPLPLVGQRHHSIFFNIFY